MPHHKAFEKSLRRDAARRIHNRAQRSRLRHALRDFRALTDAKAAAADLPKVAAILDKAAKTHQIHPSAANRLKSRIALHLARLEAGRAA